MMMLNIVIFALILMTVITGVHLYRKNHKAKYLVFSSVGDRNNVQSWVLDSTKKNFDLVIYYYGDKEEPVFDTNFIVKRKGLKFDNFHHFLTHNDISKYDAIWVADDDIIIDTDSINQMFQIFSENKLWLAQPSFDGHSHAPHIVTRNKPGCVLHYTNFIENGVAIFSTEIIQQLMGTFLEAKTGFGVDYIWPSLLHFPEDKIAVIDAVTCNHPSADYSALDLVVPRHLHKIQGAELLIKYGLLPCGWRPTDSNPWPKPYKLKEYSKIGRDY